MRCAANDGTFHLARSGEFSGSGLFGVLGAGNGSEKHGSGIANSHDKRRIFWPRKLLTESN